MITPRRRRWRRSQTTVLRGAQWRLSPDGSRSVLVSQHTDPNRIRPAGVAQTLLHVPPAARAERTRRPRCRLHHRPTVAVARSDRPTDRRTDGRSRCRRTRTRACATDDRARTRSGTERGTGGQDDDDDARGRPQAQLVAEGDHPGHADAAERDGRAEHALREDAARRHVHLVHRGAHGRGGQAVHLPGAGVPHRSHIVETLRVHTRQHHRETVDGHAEGLHTLVGVSGAEQLAVRVHVQLGRGHVSGDLSAQDTHHGRVLGAHSETQVVATPVDRVNHIAHGRRSRAVERLQRYDR